MTSSTQELPVKPRLMPISAATAYSGAARSRLYQAIAAGHVRAIKMGRRSLVETASLDSWLDSLLPAEMGKVKGRFGNRSTTT